MTNRKVSFIRLSRKQPHKFKQLGYVVIHDTNTEITLNMFDLRYTGKKSKLGKYLGDLHANGVDISSVANLREDRIVPNLEKEKEALAITLTKRLHETFAKRTVMIHIKNKTPIVKKELLNLKYSKYYEMAKRILAENDHETAIRIVNLITGYA